MSAIPDSTTNLSDEEKRWVTAFHAGDPAAMRAIYERHARPLCYFSFRITNDYHTSEDIVQELFVKVFQSRKKFLFEGALVRFLYRSAHNASINFKLYKGRHIEVDVADTQDELQPDVFHEMVLADARYELYVLLQQLSEQHREIVLSSVVDGKSAQEIAEEMNMTVTNVRTSKHRALGLLKAYALYQQLIAKFLAPTMLIIYLLWKALDTVPKKL
jgi:RNA polymerase sigma-70 factor (ECF subfamily)